MKLVKFRVLPDAGAGRSDSAHSPVLESSHKCITVGVVEEETAKSSSERWVRLASAAIWATSVRTERAGLHLACSPEKDSV